MSLDDTTEERKPATPQLRTPYSAKPATPSARPFLGNPLALSRQAIINICLLMSSSPVAADDANITITTTTTTTTTTTEETIAASGYRISLGLVEISALATLIGATNAEALALGLAAAVGLPWAPISTFGAIHVIKVALAAVVSDRIREALGLRSGSVDSALGMMLEIDPKRTPHNANSGTPCAVLIQYSDLEINHETFVDEKEVGGAVKPGKDRDRRAQAVFTFEKSTASILASIPDSKPGEKLEIFQYSQDRGPGGLHNISYDRVALFASLLKLAEVYALWQVGATTIWWVTGLAWGHGFLSASILQILDLSRDSLKLGQVDIVAGDLPSPLLPGGSRKVLLGLPGNVKRHYMWRIVWGTSTVVNCLAILCTFISLGVQSIKTVYIWVGFQVLWLLMRTFVHNFLTKGHTQRSIILSRPWEMATTPMKKRIVNLMLGLAKQQITIHPRGAFAYQEDLVSPGKIMEMYRNAGCRLLDAIPLEKIPNNQRTNIEIVGVVGDTVLRSSNWFQGVSALSPDLYDCALVFVEIAGSFFAVPGVRVLSGLPTGDVEDRVSGFEPRGTTNNGFEVSWDYWIPVKDDIPGQFWLEASGMNMKKAKTGILTHKELQTKLQGGGLYISLTQVGEVERILAESRIASEILMRCLMDSEFN